MNRFKLCVAASLPLLSGLAHAEKAIAPEAPADSATYETIPLPAPEAVAPEQDAERTGLGISEIVVTAQRRSENLNDVPIAISAFSGEDLAALGVRDTRDLANLVPGFTAADGGGNTPIYTLRGVGFNDTTYTATSTVGVYLDEVSLPYSIMTKGGALDLERVEVLKGPQGILNGRNTTGGAINFIARKPTDLFEAGLTASLARFMTSEIEGFVSGPLSDNLRGRIALKDTRSQEGWQYSNTRPDDELGEKDKQVFRGALDWSASETLELRAVVEGWRDRSDAQARQAIGIRQQNGADPSPLLISQIAAATGLNFGALGDGLFLPPQTRAYPVLSASDADPRAADWPDTFPWQLNDQFLSGSLRADWKLSDRSTLTAIASQLRVESDESEIPSAGFNFNAFEQVLTAHIETSSLELRLAGVLGADDQWQWLVGGNASKDRGFERREQIADFQSALFPDPITGRSTLTNRPGIVGSSEVEQIAGFVNLGWAFADTWKLTLGGRYTDQTQDYEGCAYASEQSDYDFISAVFTGLSAVNAAQFALATGMPGDPSIITTGECFTLAANGSSEAFKDTLAEDNVSLRAALDWQPDSASLYYVSAGRGYKAGGYPVLSASGQEQLLPVTQEEVLALEVGAKLTLLERQLQLNLAGYLYDYTDKQLLTKSRDPIFGPLPVLQNAPKSEVYGIELDAQIAPNAVDGLFFALSGAYTHTRIEEFVGLDQQGVETDFSGRPFNFAPRWQGTGVVSYQRPISRGCEMLLGADYRYSGTTSSALEADPVFKHRAYGLVGARAGLIGDGWSLTLFGRNLTNELVPITVLAFGDSINRFVGEPRTYGLSLSYDWY